MSLENFFAKNDPPHLLIHHSADVAACFEKLIGQDIFRHRLARLAGREDIGEINRQRLCVLAALHDVGKFNHGFQRRVRGEQNQAGHVSVLLAFFVNESRLRKRFLEAIDFEEIIRWCSDEAHAASLLIATFSHHGRPQRAADEVVRSLWEADPETGRDPFYGMKELLSFVREWYPLAFSAEQTELLPTTPEFEHAFSGLLTLADWLASDARFFPYSDQLDETRIDRSRICACKALQQVGLDSSTTRSVLKSEPSFTKTFGHERPRPLQEKIIDNLSLPDDASVTIIESETGSGKTEAAYFWFLKLFRERRVDGMYFALPTRAAAVQIHSRIRKWTANVFGDSAPAVVLAVPGYLKVDDVEGYALPGFEVCWPDDDQERLRYRGWAVENGKRYLAGTIVVGTIDQVLLSALQINHADMRYAMLLRHLLVIDEVHASDNYMSQVLEYVLDWHLQAGGHALLLSATLGSKLKIRCLFPQRQSNDINEEYSQYPLITKRTGNSGRIEKFPVGEKGKEKCVRVELRGEPDDNERIAEWAVSAARRGAKVLIIRNLVDDAIGTQQAVEERVGDDKDILFSCAGVPAPHHGRFAPEDRKSLDSRVEELFGKESTSRGVVLVATQTVEQSLDIDADFMITDLVPMDVFLQRLGRLHRHHRDRPEGFCQPRVVVLTPQDGFLPKLTEKPGKGPHGWGTVYQDLGCLEATRLILKEKREIVIPKMNRELVEDALNWNGLDKELWHKHWQWLQGRTTAEKLQANFSVIPRGVSFIEVESEFCLDGVSRTRLGTDDRLIRFQKPPIGPFGKKISQIKIPGWMVPEEVDTQTEIEVEESCGRLYFTLQDTEFCYDRLGLRKDV